MQWQTSIGAGLRHDYVALNDNPHRARHPVWFVERYVGKVYGLNALL